MLEWAEGLMLHGVKWLELLAEGLSVLCVLTGLVLTAWAGMQRASLGALRLSLGRWLALALEFQLAADILATTIAPSQEALIQLGLIALIRTFLNYFLAKELLAESMAENNKGRD